MLGFLKRKHEPAGPFEFEHGIDIERPAAEVYPLLDWADARNAKRALGNKVEQVGSAPDRFRMVLDIIPDVVFEMTVTDAVPGRSYAFENDFAAPVGRLVSSHESYTVEPLGDGSCRLGLTVAATFVGGLSDEVLAGEVMVMAMSCENALAKLKIQAEQGVEAVHAVEAAQIDCIDDLDDFEDAC
jgi:hypothetical protein